MTIGRRQHTGAAVPTVLAGTINSSVLSLAVTTGTGAGYPSTPNFVLHLDAGDTSEEKILCSARSGDTFTVASGGRGWDGTMAAAHQGGSATVELCFPADEADDASDHIYNVTRDDHPQYVLVGSGAGAIVARAHMSPAQTITTTAVIVFNTEDFDTRSAYNPATGLFTCPVTGYYRVTFCFSTFTGSPQGAQIAHNGTGVATISIDGGSDLVSCTAADTLSVVMYQPDGGTTVIEADEANYVNFELVH